MTHFQILQLKKSLSLFRTICLPVLCLLCPRGVWCPPAIPALPICTASLVSFPWRTDFSFLCILDFFLSLSSPSPPSALFSGCISMAAAPSCCLADNAEQKLLLQSFSPSFSPCSSCLDPASITGAGWDNLCPWLLCQALETQWGSAGHSTSLRTRGDLGWKIQTNWVYPSFYPHPWHSGPCTCMPLNALDVTWQWQHQHCRIPWSSRAQVLWQVHISLNFGMENPNKLGLSLIFTPTHDALGRTHICHWMPCTWPGRWQHQHCRIPWSSRAQVLWQICISLKFGISLRMQRPLIITFPMQTFWRPCGCTDGPCVTSLGCRGT